MFDRFTEHARRAIFFARYEASNLGSGWIETEHLLLGLMREDRVLPSSLTVEAKEQIRAQIELRFPVRQSISTSVDLPLSADSKRVLAYGFEESHSLHHKVIDCGHLVLGLLRIEKCAAAGLLRDHGIDYARLRVIVSQSPPAKADPLDPMQFGEAVGPADSPPADEPLAPSLRSVIARFNALIDEGAKHLDAFSEADALRHLSRKPWSRKEALGYLIDWAAAHQQWFARALTEPRLDAGEYPADEWVAAQQYRLFAWPETVDLWVSINRLLIHVLGQVPEDKLNTPCRVGIRGPMPLSALILHYVDRCDDILGQILVHT